MNQLFNQLNRQSFAAQSPQNNQIINTFHKVKMMTDPVGYLSSMPEMKNIMNLVQQNGGNAQQLFYQLAEQKGVDPNQILDMFR